MRMPRVAQPLGIVATANAAARHGLFRFRTNRNVGKTNKYADKHHEEFDLAHVFASAVIPGKLRLSKKRSKH